MANSLFSGTFCTLAATLLIMFSVACTQAETQEPRQVLFIAGAPSHGFGNHEHLGGSRLLAQTINDAAIGVEASVVSGWPSDATVFEGVDAIVIFANGGPGHPAMPHLEQLDAIMEQGVSLVTIHYAVEMPPGDPGNKLVRWTGGNFETHWTVNPFWDGRFEHMPEHPATRGVTPFEVRDEWYYHMRFANNFDNITPILTDLPPQESLSRPDGPHSNNPHVREAVLERKEPQHVAWAYERPGNSGRGFGFTGGHYHWNWGVDAFRKLMVNGIVWAAGGEVPSGGVPVQPISVAELAEMTDDPIPDGWDPSEIQARIDRANQGLPAR